MKLTKKIWLCTALLVWLGQTYIEAQTTSWASAASGNWNTDSSWNPATVPGVGTNASITVAGTFAVTYDSPMDVASIASLTLGSGTSIPTLTLTAAGFNVVGTCTLVDSAKEIININSGGVMTNGTLAMTSQNGQVNVNGGALTNKTTQVANNGSNDGDSTLKINSGTASLGAVTIGRHTQSITRGLIIVGGNVSAASIDIGSRNSYASMVVGGGTVTNAGNLRLGTGATTTSPQREVRYHQTNGTVVCGGTVDIPVATNYTTWFNVSGASTTFYAAGVRIFPNALASASFARLTNSGSIYLGSSGLKVLNSGTYTFAMNDQSILGATADWSGNVNIVTSGSSTVTFKAGDSANVAHNITLTNAISGGANVVKTGGGTLALYGTNTYTGSTTVSAGSLVLGNATALPKGTALTIGSSGNSAVVDLAGFSPQVSALATVGAAANQLITNSSSVTASSLTFSNSSVSSTFGGKIAGDSKPIALTILGGNLTLISQNTYGGNIFISNGKLALSGIGSTFTGPAIVLSNSAAILDLTGMNTLTLSGGQSLAGFGSVTGNVTVADCPVTPGANGSGGTLNISGGLTLNGNVTNQFDLLFDPNSTGNDLINVGGALNVSGLNTIKLNALGGSLSQGTYHLIKSSSVGSGTTNNFQLTGSPGAGLQAFIDVTATGVDLIVSQSGGLERVWVGDGVSNFWDHTSTNWLNAGLPDIFADGSFDVFDDTSTNFVVNFSETLFPATVTIAATNDYSFVGVGKISGNAVLIKTNSGTLTVLTTNDYNNLTLVEQGTVQVGDGLISGALGTGSLVNDGCLIMQQPNSASLSNAISGSGGLIQSGTATLTLNGSNSFSGGVLINSGTLQIGNGGTPGTGNVTNNSAFVFNSINSNSVPGIISGSGTLGLLGSGTVTLSAINTYSGDTIVSNGTFLVNGTNSGSGSITVSSTGKLGGKGKISGMVTVNSGATLAPGSSVGTLTINNNLVLNSGAILNFELGTNSDKVIVSGNLNLAGTLNVSDAGGLVNGTYTLFTYAGTLTVNNLTLGAMPSGKLCGLDTNTPGQVNLIVGLPAFPGALGFGSIASGGRGGSVYHVTTLADSGAGSFRYGATNYSGSRIIVFDVGGYISLNSAVSVNGNITIAGQTAPGGGIGFKGGEISFANKANVICRYIRVRPGSDTDSGTDDALSLFQAKNVILDHCSFEFAPWNNIDGVGDSSHVITNITFQNCIIADPTGQQFGCHSESVGGTWSWFYNVFANSHNRNPLAKANTVFINNVLYNCDAGYTTHTSTPFKHDIVNNYFVGGPASGGNFPWFQIDNNQSMYFTGNLADKNLDGVLNGITTVPLPGYQGGGTVLSSPWSSVTTNMPIYSTASACRLVISRAGTLPLDEMDNLIMNQVKTLGSGTTGTGVGTRGPNGSLYTSQTQTGLGNNGYGSINGSAAPLDTDGDAMPDYWETAVGLNPNNANDATNTTLSGYPQLEVYLNWLGEPHAIAPINANLDIDLFQYSSGFTNIGRTFSISNVINGTVTLLPDGHTARYTPPTNFTGRASFLFKVVGSDGSSMTNVIGLVVTGTVLPQDLTWRGDGSANVWDIGTTTNWVNGTNLTIFRAADSVTFDDTGSNSPNVNLTTTLIAGGITVDATKNYTFAGSGSLSGAASLTKAGSGTLSISTTNSGMTGSIDLGDGGLTLLVAGANVGSGTVTLHGGAAFTLALSGSIQADNPIDLPANETGTLASGSVGNRFAGAITGGSTSILNISNGVSFNQISPQFTGFFGTVVVPSGSSFRFSGTSGSNGGDNTTFNVNGILQMRNSGTTGNLGALTGSGTLGGAQSPSAGTVAYNIGAKNLNTTFTGQIVDANGVNTNTAITKVGSGTLTLTGLSAFTGLTTVSAGTLFVNGTNSGSSTIVSSGATLGGSGQIGGAVTVNSGGNLIPGVGVGTLNVGGNLTLNAAALNFDLSNITTAGSGVNDLISLNGGNITLSGTSTVVPNFLNGALATGSYTLISGGASTTGSAANLTWGGIVGTRQNFAFDLTTPGAVLLQVSGSLPASLVWQGTNGNNWDFATTNWLNGIAADKFFNADSVLFDDTSTNGNVNIAVTVQPGSVIVSNNATAYTFSGGAIAGNGPLTKNGSGTLTLSSSNGLTGGAMIHEGTIAFANDTANASSLGSGTVTLNGGTLTMFDSPATTNNAAWNLFVPTNATGTLNADSRCNLSGSLIGGGTFNFNVISNGTSLFSDWSAFSGRINVAGSGEFRVLNFTGYSNAAIVLSNNVIADFQGAVDPNGTTLGVGELSGTSSSQLLGGTNTSGEILTWNIGTLNTDAIFSGHIGEQNTNAITAITKLGTGSWTITGSNSYNGDTLVSAGKLVVGNSSGSATGFGDVEVVNGASIGGTGTVNGALFIDAGATFAPGNPVGALSVGGDLVIDSAATSQFALGTNSSLASVGGNLTFAGALNLTNAPGFTAGTYVLFNYSGALNLGAVTISNAPAGFNYSISTNTPGQVKLVVQSIAPPASPVFGGINFSGGNFIFSGTGGVANAQFYLLGSTNLGTPVSNWTRLLTNQFDENGNFLFTNPADANFPQNFYLLQLP